MLQPVYTNLDPLAGPEQTTEVAKFAKQGWRYRGGTVAERNALPANEMFDGQVWTESDNGRGVYARIGGAWVLTGRVMGKRGWTFKRPANAQGYDGFAAGAFASMASGVIPSAPAGQYKVEAQATVSADGPSIAFRRLVANGASFTDEMPFNIEAKQNPIGADGFYDHAGGNLTIDFQCQVASLNGLVFPKGTYISAMFVGA